MFASAFFYRCLVIVLAEHGSFSEVATDIAKSDKTDHARKALVDSGARSLNDDRAASECNVSTCKDVCSRIQDGRAEQESASSIHREQEHQQETGSQHGEHHNANTGELVMAVMTLCAVAFQMSLFYIVNFRDDDIRRYALSVIGDTISIFCSILLTSALFSFIEISVDPSDALQQSLVCLALCLFLFVFLEALVVFAARIRGERALLKATVGVSKLAHKKMDLEIPQHELNAKTLGAAAAQMCAAATMRGFGHMQVVAYTEHQSISMLCLWCPISFLSIFAVVYLTSHIRKCVILWDSHVDDAEMTWIRVAEECEDEIICLCSGFHCAVAIRVIVTDSFPHMLHHGHEHQSEDVVHLTSTLILLGAGFASACLCIALNVAFFGRVSAGINFEKLRSDSISRMLRVFTESIGLVSSWCTCFGTHLFAVYLTNQSGGLGLRLIIALIQSFGCFVIVLLLDFISDMKCAGPAVDKAIIMIIFSFGASVGLAWEQAFHTCAGVVVDFMVEDQSNPIFKLSDDPRLWAICLALVICLTVFPAYRFYIAPRRQQLIEEHEHELHHREEEYMKALGSRISCLNEEIFVFDTVNTQLETELTSNAPTRTPASH